ncbi:MAG: glycosyltransferase family 39 protein [Thermoleophilia bacterium]
METRATDIKSEDPSKERITRRDIFIAVSLFTAALATRIPFRSKSLYSWDSAGFALALERYSIPDHQPHSPGYILYIALGRFFNLFLTDANTALVAISILSGSIAVAGIYFFTRSIFDRTTGIVAAVLLLFSPLAWFYSEVALSYELELPFAIAVTWFLYQMIFNRRYALAGSIVLGIAAGFRQDVIFFFGIFWLIGTIRCGRRAMLYSWGAIIVTVLAWFVPLLYLAGGITKYRSLSQGQFDSGVYPLSIFANGFDGLLTNIKLIVEGVFLLLGPAGIVIICGLTGLLLSGLFHAGKKVFFLMLLPLPAVLFFVVFIFDPPGYLLVFGAPILVLAARAMVQVSKDAAGALQRHRGGGGGIGDIDKASTTAAAIDIETTGPMDGTGIRILIVITALTSIVNSSLFLLSARVQLPVPSAEHSITGLYTPFSYGRLREIERQMDAVTSDIRRFDPASALVILPSSYDCDCFDPEWRQLAYYLPEYRIMVMRTDQYGHYEILNHDMLPETDEPVIIIAPEYKQLVFLGFFPDSPNAPLPLTLVPGSSARTPVTTAEMPSNGFRMRPYVFSR